MKKSFCMALAVFLVIVFGSLNAFAAPVVINGSFELDSFGSQSLDIGGSNPLTGWTTNHNGTYPWGLSNTINVYNAGPTPYGDQWVVVGNYGYGGTYIQQTVSGFDIGQTYTLDFALASEMDGQQGSLVEVSFLSGSSTAAQTFTAPLRGADYWDTWGSFSMNFVADSTDVSIRFLGLAGLGYDAGIDNVSIIGGGTSVPEPGTLLLLGSGLSMFFIGARFRG